MLRILVVELVDKVVLVPQEKADGFIFLIVGGRQSMGGLLGKGGYSGGSESCC